MIGQDHLITLDDGVKISVSHKGEGLPLIWAHGLFMSRGLDDQLQIIPWDQLSRTCQLIRYDARGHGQSGATLDPQKYVWKNLADDMLAIADHLKIDQFIAGGSSMGTGTSIWVAVKYPDRVKGLVLNIPPTAWETRVKRAVQILKELEWLEQEGLERFIELRKAMSVPDFFKNEPELVNLGLDQFYSRDFKVICAIQKGAALSDLPAREEIAALKVPRLILAKTGDPYHPLSTANELHHLITHSRLIVSESLNQARDDGLQVLDFVKQVSEEKKVAEG